MLLENALCADSVCTFKCSLALQVGCLSGAMSLLVAAQLFQSLCCLCTNVQQQGLIVAGQTYHTRPFQQHDLQSSALPWVVLNSL